VFFRAKGERVDVDTRIRGASVVLVRLHLVKVSSFTFRETILTVKLELSSDDGVLTPAVHVKGRFGEHKSAGIRDTRGGVVDKGGVSTDAQGSPGIVTTSGDIHGSRVIEETRAINEVASRSGLFTTKRHDGVGEGVNPVSVVEGLSTEGAVEVGTSRQGRAVINVGIGLDNEHQLLAGVVKVEFDLVGGRPDRFITSKLELFNEVFVGVLCHTATLISVQEDVVHIEGRGNEGLVVSVGDTLAGTIRGGQITNSPQALINGTNIQVNLDFVVLKSDEGERKPGVAAIPELEGHIESGFREGTAGFADLSWGIGRARTVNRGERGVSDEGKLGGVTNHLEITTLLFLGESELIPQVHPITILAINALTSDFNFNLGNHLFPREIEPTSPDTLLTGTNQLLVDFRECDLQVSAVSQITVAANGTRHSATKVSLTVKGLLNGLHGIVGVATVSHLPEGNLGITCQIDILCAVSYELHQTSSHCYIIAKENNF